MYSLRQSDGREEGPLSARDVRERIASGRVDRQTLAKAADESKWRPLSDFIEFGAALEAAQTGSAAATGTETERPKTYRLLAWFGLAFSIVGFCGVTAIAGLVLGVTTLLLHKKKPQQFGGTRIAAAAVLISLAWLIALPSFAYFKFNEMRRAHYKGEGCFMHVRSLVTSLQVISIANNNTYPAAETWCDAIRHEVTSTNHYQCPDDPKHAVCSYAYNAKLSGARNPNPNTVAVFESDLGWNGSGGRSNLVAKPRHGKHLVVGFVGGMVRPVSTNELPSLRWDP